MGNGGERGDDFRFRRRFPQVSCRRIMKTHLFLAACLFATVRAEPVPERPEFIRVVDTETATELQTAVAAYEKDGVTLDLVGAVHIADRKYYQGLNRRFERYDALLFEGIGGGKAAAAPAAELALPEGEVPPEDGQLPAEKPKANLGGLHAAYQAGSDWLGLSYQMQEIDYTKNNFVHADVTLEEFAALQAERGETLTGFMFKTSLQKPAKGAGRQPSSFRLLTSLVSGNKNGVKREFVHSLGSGVDQIAGLANDNVIIGDRNAKCLEVLDREVTAGRKKLGIFYGAAHFPDMERRLLEAGWKKTGTEWMTAWDVGK